MKLPLTLSTIIFVMIPFVQINAGELREIDKQLATAVKERKPQNVETFLKKNANPNVDLSIEYPEYPLLMDAIKKREYSITKLLLEYGANPNKGCAFDGVFESPLTLAIDSNSTQMIQLLLNYDTDIYGKFGSELPPAIIYGVMAQNIDNVNIVKILIKNGADVNSMTFWHGKANTVLSYALKSNNSELIELLKKEGAKDKLTIEELTYISKNHKAERQRSIAKKELKRIKR